MAGAFAGDVDALPREAEPDTNEAAALADDADVIPH